MAVSCDGVEAWALAETYALVPVVIPVITFWVGAVSVESSVVVGTTGAERIVFIVVIVAILAVGRAFVVAILGVVFVVVVGKIVSIRAVGTGIVSVSVTGSHVIVAVPCR
jgi:hypothetical protein